MRTSSPTATRTPAGVRLACAGAALGGVAAGTSVPGSSATTADAVVVLVCVTCSLRASGAAAAAVAALAWAVQDGFVTHRLGDLGARGVDVEWLVSLLATALAASATSRARRTGGRVHPSGAGPRPGSVRSRPLPVRPSSGRVPAPRRHG